ncbi:hypothetical protein GOBAR_DD11629 [Gossypium barbadense]|nr:hypothetical protein GOBAR_DD11629 [Gossypium barbadense]
MWLFEWFFKFSKCVFKNRYVVNASQGQTSLYVPSTTGSEAASWNMYRVENHSAESGSFSNFTYHHVQHSEPSSRTIQDGSNATLLATSSSLGETNTQLDYGGYTSYSNSAGTYSHGSAGYQGYYSGYQQQPNPSYSASRSISKHRQLEVAQAVVTLIRLPHRMGAIIQIILLSGIQTTLKIQVGLMSLVMQVSHVPGVSENLG